MEQLEASQLVDTEREPLGRTRNAKEQFSCSALQSTDDPWRHGSKPCDRIPARSSRIYPGLVRIIHKMFKTLAIG